MGLASPVPHRSITPMSNERPKVGVAETNRARTLDEIPPPAVLLMSDFSYPASAKWLVYSPGSKRAMRSLIFVRGVWCVRIPPARKLFWTRR